MNNNEILTRRRGCEHREVKAYADGETDNFFAYCTFCEEDLSAWWFGSHDRHDYVLMPRNLGRTQTFLKKATVKP